MKFLVLSCNTGEGHNSAAKAIYNELLKRNYEAYFLDSLSFASNNVSKKVSNCYVNVAVKSPKFFSFLYKAGSFISSSKHKSPVYYANKLYRDKMYKYLCEENFDGIITPHLFPAQTLTSIKRKYGLDVPTIGVATDYTSIPFWEETELDFYMIPHSDLIEEFNSRGIPKDKLQPFGIPVDNKFLKHTKKEIACEELGLDYTKHNYLLMSGSMGFGDLQDIADHILNIDNNSNVHIICGNNKKLKASLDDIYKDNTCVKINGYINNVDLYMDACDVIFTKPGGLSSTESAVKNIPLIHTAPIPGCETKNIEFFTSRNISYYNKDIKNEVEYAYKLMTDEALREEMIQAQSKYINKNACNDICDFVVSLTKKETVLND